MHTNIPAIRRECLKSSWVKTMKLKSIGLLSLLLTGFLLFTVGCSGGLPGISTEPDSLKVLTPEDIESIFAEVSYEEEVKYPVETDENGKELVLWLDGGTVWHVSSACSTIKKADPSKVKTGSVQDAIGAGKKRQCKICGGDSETATDSQFQDESESAAELTDLTDVAETEKYAKEYSPDGKLIVFWLESGKVWHESRYCISLARSDQSKILRGSQEDALSAGKERVCKNCSS